MFRTSADAAPVRYYYTKDTTILDPEGRTVTWSAVRPDTPATVYYTNVGDRVVVRKVVLSQPTTIYKKETNDHNNDKRAVRQIRCVAEFKSARRKAGAFFCYDLRPSNPQARACATFNLRSRVEISGAISRHFR